MTIAFGLLVDDGAVAVGILLAVGAAARTCAAWLWRRGRLGTVRAGVAGAGGIAAPSPLTGAPCDEPAGAAAWLR